MIIAIDGPAGSGKSATAREVAKRLRFLHLDSGALYRAFALVAWRRGWTSRSGEVAAERSAELAAADVGAELVQDALVPSLDGSPLGEEIRTPEVTSCASKISIFPEIRARVNEILRRVAATHPRGVVCEGRDMGTVVFPDAELKIYMEAAPSERARRRLLQRGEEVTAESLRNETRRLLERDRDDSRRSLSPLRRADDAQLVDTTELSFEEQVERIVEAARRLLDTA
jgi:cytidylate kinase